jgi:hypothetical protein
MKDVILYEGIPTQFNLYFYESGGFGKGTSVMNTMVAVQGVSGSAWAAASARTPTDRRRWLVSRRSAPTRKMWSARCSG